MVTGVAVGDRREDRDRDWNGELPETFEGGSKSESSASEESWESFLWASVTHQYERSPISDDELPEMESSDAVRDGKGEGGS